jgi:DNA-binding MarR family transcriptional regulator
MLARDLGELALGSRFRQLSDRLFDAVDEVYRAENAGIEARWFLLLRCLLDHGPMTVSTLAERLGQSHPAVSQLSKKLIAEGLVERRSDARDLRRSTLALSAEGERRMAALKPLWGSITEAMRATIAASGQPLLDALSAFEAELERQPAAERILRRHAERRAAAVRIVPFDPALRGHFYRLNAEWLTRYFAIEEIDHRVLSQPEDHILRPGGRIFFGVYELTKMAVTERCQGLGIGRKLLAAAIAEYHALGGERLFLESQETLQAALRLYASMGFERQPGRKPDSHYQRSDVYMIYRPAQQAAA